MNKSVHPRAVILLIYIPTIAPPRNFYQGELIYRCKAAARLNANPSRNRIHGRLDLWKLISRKRCLDRYV